MNKEKTLFIPPGVEVEIIEGEGVLVIEFDGYQVIEGGTAAAIMEIVMAANGTREAVFEALGGHSERHVLDGIISFLIRDGFLVEATSAGTGALKRCGSWPPDTVQEALATKSVCLTSIGPAVDCLTQTLAARGIQQNSSPALHLVVTGNLCDERLLEIHERRIKDGLPWLLLYADEEVAAYTLFVPGRTACWQCLKRAFLSNMPRRKGPGPVAGTAAWMRAEYEVLASRIIAWFMEERAPDIEGALIVHRPGGVRQTRHVIRTLHGCRACSTSIPLQHDFQAALHKSGRRTRTLEEAWKALEPLVSPLTGIAWNPCQLPAPAEGLGCVCVFQHPIARQTRTFQSLRVNTQSRSIGKGRAPREALLSGLGEAIERYSGIWRPSIQVVRTSYADLPGRGLHPKMMLGYSERQYAERDRWNSTTQYPMLRVPGCCKDTTVIDWVSGWSLTHNEPCFVPATLAFYDHPDKGLGYADSNGCAAGEEPADAILGGLLELVERDAVAIWWYNRICRGAINLEHFDDSWIRRQPGAHACLGRSLEVLDISTDLGPRVFVAVSRDKDDWALGFGCHWEAQKAVTGALLESSQVLTVRNGSDTPVFEGHPATGELERFLSPGTSQEIGEHNYLSGEWPLLQHPVDTLATRNLETIVVDQTHPDVGIPVVRVIVPGLVHHWRRFAPRRLYETPARLGWQAVMHKETELNPYSLVL